MTGTIQREAAAIVRAASEFFRQKQSGEEGL